MIECKPEPTNLDRLATIQTTLRGLTDRMSTIMSEQLSHGVNNGPLQDLLAKVGLFTRYTDLVADVASRSVKGEKQLCIKYKQLDRALVQALHPETICWKYLFILLEEFKRVLTREFTPVLNLHQYYGEIEFSDYFTTRIGLVTRIVEQFLELLPVGILVDPDDIFQKVDGSDESKQVELLVEKVSLGNPSTIHSKYLSLGWMFKTLKVSFNQSGGNLFRAVLNLPYYFIFNSRLETRANQFFSDPNESILSEVWNAPNDISVARWSLSLLSKLVKTKQDLFFDREFLPAFTLKAVENKTYLDTIQACKDKFKAHAQTWDFFSARKETAQTLRATVLSQAPSDPKMRSLPLGKDTKNTIVLYSGGGGFLANLQMIQENFLKKWAINTGVTVVQLHYGLSPENKYPVPVVDLLNMYLQVVWYYKHVMGVQDLQVILMGDSAGGAIMLSVVNILAALNTELPVKVVAVYPPVDLRMGRFSPSMLHSLEDQLLYFTVAKTCFKAYVPEDITGCKDDWIMSPGLAPSTVLTNYPSTFFFVGEKDSLRDDIIKLAYKIRAASRPCRLVQVDSIYHGFLGFQLPLGMGISEVDKLHGMLQGEILKTIR